MAATGKLYGLWLKLILDGTRTTDWDDNSTTTIKCALTTNTYSPDQDTHDYFDDVTNEVSGTGYSAGGAAFTSRTITYTSGTNTLALDGADVTWSSSTITARKAVVYKDSGTPGTSPLICYQDNTSADVSTTSGTFTVAWDASGIVSIVVS